MSPPLVPLCVAALLLTVPGPIQARESQSLTVRELVRTGHSWDGVPLPAYPNGSAEITILRIIIPPGSRLPRHRHPVINAGVMLRGRLTVVTMAGKTLHLKTGDPIVEVVDTWHSGINEGTEDAEIIVFYAGTPGRELSIGQHP